MKNFQNSVFAQKRQCKKTVYCMQNAPHTYVIDPYGSIYTCLEEAGREDCRIGHIGCEGVVFFKLKDTYLSRNLCKLDKCLDCPFGLVCGGGCGVRSKKINGSIFVPDCHDYKASIAETIRFSYLENKKSSNKVRVQ